MFIYQRVAFVLSPRPQVFFHTLNMVKLQIGNCFGQSNYFDRKKVGSTSSMIVVTVIDEMAHLTRYNTHIEYYLWF